jgi:hypothetical protein
MDLAGILDLPVGINMHLVGIWILLEYGFSWNMDLVGIWTKGQASVYLIL